MAKNLTEQQIARRKQLQSRISQTTGALGLASLGAYGLSKVPGSRVASATPRLRRVSNRINTKRAKDTALGLSTTGAGIGGAGSFNFASYTGAEAKKKVKKSADEVPLFGEEGIAKRYEEEISKIGDWKTIDQRERTQRRDRKVQTAAGGAIGTGAALTALGYQEGDKAQYKKGAERARSINNFRRSRNFLDGVAGKKPSGNLRSVKAFGQAGQNTFNSLSPKGKAGLGLIAGGAAVGGAAKGQQTYHQHKINQRRRNNFKKNWAPTKDKVFDSERSRKARADAYPVAAGAALGGASVMRAGRALTLRDAAAKTARQKKAGSAASAKKLIRNSNRAGKQAAVLAAAAPAAAYGLDRAKKKTWEPYAKSAPSAFGVQH